MRVQCTTNIDCAKLLPWPIELPERPVVGDLIRSPASTNTKHIEMEVCRCVWYYSVLYKEWILGIELDLIKRRYASIEEFEIHVKRVD